MKCPGCGNKFPMQGNSKEVLGVPTLECPSCHARFEMQALQKMFPKGMLIMLVASMLFGFLPPELSIPLFVVAMVPLFRWLYRPENIVKGNSEC